MNDYLSRTIPHTLQVDQMIMLQTNTVVIVTVVVYDYCE